MNRTRLRFVNQRPNLIDEWNNQCVRTWCDSDRGLSVGLAIRRHVVGRALAMAADSRIRGIEKGLTGATYPNETGPPR
jgi:hypothetical protein